MHPMQIIILAAFTLAGLMINRNRFSYAGIGKRPYGLPQPKPKPKPKRSSFTVLKALVKNSGVGSVAISGKIAGTVWANSGSAGAFIRVWAKPKNARTALQQFVRGVMSGISSSFRALTPDEVAAWNDAATSSNNNALRVNVFGDSKVISGAQLFQRVNNVLQLVGVASVTNPPLVAPVDSITNCVATADVSSNQFDLDLTTFLANTTVPANTHLVVEATTQLSNGRSFFGKSQYRTVAVYDNPTAINPLDFFTDYTTKFGALVAGSKIGVRMRFVFANTGLFSQSGAFYVTVNVVA